MTEIKTKCGNLTSAPEKADTLGFAHGVLQPKEHLKDGTCRTHS